MEAGLGDPDTRQHIGSFFERTPEERTGLARSNHQAQCCNFGPAAGQTVPHLHIHLIPR